MIKSKINLFYFFRKSIGKMFPFESKESGLKIFEKSINYLDIKQRVNLRLVCKIWRLLIDNSDKELIVFSSYSFLRSLWPTGAFNFNNVVLNDSYIITANTTFLDKLRVFKSFFTFLPSILKTFEKFRFLNYLEVGGIYFKGQDNVEMIELVNLTTLFIIQIVEGQTDRLLCFNCPKLIRVNFGMCFAI